ncbi:MAG: signal peptide peptidase SppA [Thermodesulfobacteriota bacterium]|nr:signal peptide peptidase SppA [Thermodesulfobacteriota bacterium]
MKPFSAFTVSRPALLLFAFLIAGILSVVLPGCSLPGLKLPADATDPLQEFVLEGSGPHKIALVSVNGAITDKPTRDFMSRNHPGMLDEFVAQLALAKEDPSIKALVLKVNSPGGTITASDIMYKELMDFKHQTGKPVVAALMDVAASGGYYISLPADHILAHPTTLTGSVGVIFVTPRVSGLMDKLGLDLKVRKSGKHKDMGSPFRDTTAEEDALFDAIIDDMAGRFAGLVEKHRADQKPDMEKIKTARIFTADDALSAGLVDRIGYLEDALAQAKKMAGLPDNAAVVTYRRTYYPNDTIYNTLVTQYGAHSGALVNIDLLEGMPALKPGLYYLWWPGAGNSAQP